MVNVICKFSERTRILRISTIVVQLLCQLNIYKRNCERTSLVGRVLIIDIENVNIPNFDAEVIMKAKAEVLWYIFIANTYEFVTRYLCRGSCSSVNSLCSITIFKSVVHPKSVRKECILLICYIVEADLWIFICKYDENIVLCVAAVNTLWTQRKTDWTMTLRYKGL